MTTPKEVEVNGELRVAVLTRTSVNKSFIIFVVFFLLLTHFAAIQQPAAIRMDAIMNIMVTGSPNNKIDNRAPMNGARA